MRVAEVSLESDLCRGMFCDGSEQLVLAETQWRPIFCHQIAPGDSNVRFTPNYDLLQVLYNDVLPSDQTLFFQVLETRIYEQNPFVVYGSDLRGMGEPKRTYTELPLISEFLVRHGQEHRLIKAIRKAPLRPALTRLLLHVEEMVALDYRLFTNESYDELIRTVEALRSEFIQLQKGPKLYDTRESNYRFHVVKDGVVLCDSLLTQAPRAKYLCFSQKTILRAAGKLEGIDALRPNDEDDNFQVLAQQVRAAIEGGAPVVGLDRLHTFMVRYVRNVYTKHFGTTPDEYSTLNALLGQVANDLRSKGVIQSGMASEILKSSARVLEQFNHVRNKQTFAHDNDHLIGDGEARFIYQSVAACVRYLQELDL